LPIWFLLRQAPGDLRREACFHRQRPCRALIVDWVEPRPEARSLDHCVLPPRERVETCTAAWNISAEAAVRRSHPAIASRSSNDSNSGANAVLASASCDRNSDGG